MNKPRHLVMKAVASIILLFIAGGIISSCTKKSDTTTTTIPNSPCGTISGASYSSLTYQSVVLNWHAVSGAISYTVQYRPVGTTTWVSNVTTVDSQALSGLTASTVYEWQVQIICATGLSPFTASNIFKTDSTPPAPVYTINATYRGSVHSFVTEGMAGISMGDLTSIGGTENGTGNTIGLTQTYLTSGTASLACNPNQLPNILTLVIGGVTYENNPFSTGSETRTIGNGTATITFNGTIYNTSNQSDSLVVTNGTYSGPYTVQ